MEKRGAADGERKTITALFADLKGSTALIEDVDPEAARAMIDPALQIMMDAVHRYDGYVAQTLGDGIFCLFGAPIAHEDHPQRALFAALRMQTEMRRYADELRLKGKSPLLMRVGVNTGEVVVRSIRKDDLHTDYVPVGHSTNLAARMEQMATPGSILVSEHTYKLTAGYFEFNKLGAADIAGVEAPLDVYEVTAVGPLRTRLQVSAHRGLTEFVGRQTEMTALARALELAQGGHGQIIGVMGEPGLGKSRLFHEFKLKSQAGCLVLEAFSVSHNKASSYLPVIELLYGYFRIAIYDDARTHRQKVIGRLFELDRSLEDILPYIFSLLGIDDPQYQLPPIDDQTRRLRITDALKRLMLRESLNQPIILIFEDLHWIDAETQALLDAISDAVASARILLLTNYRPEYHHQWGNKTFYVQLRLEPLGATEAAQLLTSLLGDDPTLTGLKQLIVERTEGTPFFMEEVVQTLVEEGGLGGERGSYSLQTTPQELHIPATVQGILAARIDRFAPEEKALLQQLSVIGREFPLNLIKAVVATDEETLLVSLSALQSKEFVYEQPALTDVEYIFKHALTQDVAYGTVLQEQRRELHERIGQALESLYAAKLEDHYREIAHHFARAANSAKSIEYLKLAAMHAVTSGANEDAVRHFRAALAQLESMPESEDRMREEFILHASLVTPLGTTEGYGSETTGESLQRGRELGRHFEDLPQQAVLRYAMHRFHATRGDNPNALAEAEALLVVAEKYRTADFQLAAHTSCGAARLWMGEFSAARTHLEEALTWYDRRKCRDIIALFGDDTGVFCMAFLSASLWILGFPDQALRVGNEAIDIGRNPFYPTSLAAALMMPGGHLRHYRGEHGEALTATTEGSELLRTEKLAMFQPLIDGIRGSALGHCGQTQAGIAVLEGALDGARMTGTGLFRAFHQALLAELYAAVGEHEKEQELAATAVADIEHDGPFMHDAEVHRLQGELFLSADSPSDLQSSAAEKAEACFRTALEVARTQAARSWELRAATSLGRLLQTQGRGAEARAILEPVYIWFSEGFDTADLRDAKGLLEALQA